MDRKNFSKCAFVALALLTATAVAPTAFGDGYGLRTEAQTYAGTRITSCDTVPTPLRGGDASACFALKGSDVVVDKIEIYDRIGGRVWADWALHTDGYPVLRGELCGATETPIYIPKGADLLTVSVRDPFIVDKSPPAECSIKTPTFGTVFAHIS